MNDYRSRVYTNRPDYADLDSPAKFQAIQGIILTRLRQHPKAICSYSGGSDSDIMIDMIERARALIPGYIEPIKYVFFNTGLEMAATKRHVKETAEKYGVEIEECRPKIGIVKAVKNYGVPFYSKHFSGRLYEYQKKQIPLSIISEFQNAIDKQKKLSEINERYPKCKTLINFLLSVDKTGKSGACGQLCIDSAPFFAEFLNDFPPCFPISSKCCDYCKKQVAHQVQKGYEMVITGERRDEGGVRSVPRSEQWNETNTMCFAQQSNGQYRFRPLFYVSNKDKAWYKEHYGIRYSDAYEVYGLTRTGCCGCPIAVKAVDNLEKIRPYEPNVVKAAWNIFGESYRYRQKYNEYKAKRREEEKRNKDQIKFEEGDR